MREVVLMYGRCGEVLAAGAGVAVRIMFEREYESDEENKDLAGGVVAVRCGGCKRNRSFMYRLFVAAPADAGPRVRRLRPSVGARVNAADRVPVDRYGGSSRVRVRGRHGRSGRRPRSNCALTQIGTRPCGWQAGHRSHLGHEPPLLHTQPVQYTTIPMNQTITLLGTSVIG